MTFTLSATPDVINLHIEVKIVAGSGKSITQATTVLDGVALASDNLPPNSTQYERIFSQVGQRSPGRSHTLLVTASDSQGNQESASKYWTDTN